MSQVRVRTSMRPVPDASPCPSVARRSAKVGNRRRVRLAEIEELVLFEAIAISAPGQAPLAMPARSSSSAPPIFQAAPLDTSWWTRYRSRAHNPDLDPGFTFPQAIPGLNQGQFTAIPRTDADLTPDAHIQAIANTAGFHMPTIEQGGNSLYPSLAQRVTHPEVLRILLSIGPTETAHFQTWHDKAGNAVPLTDPTNGLVFPDLNSPPFGGEDFQTNLIMPEPCPFLSRSLPVCSVIRPTETKGAAMGALTFLTNMGLFIGQSKAFLILCRILQRTPTTLNEVSRSVRPPRLPRNTRRRSIVAVGACEPIAFARFGVGHSKSRPQADEKGGARIRCRIAAQ